MAGAASQELQLFISHVEVRNSTADRFLGMSEVAAWAGAQPPPAALLMCATACPYSGWWLHSQAAVVQREPLLNKAVFFVRVNAKGIGEKSVEQDVTAGVVR